MTSIHKKTGEVLASARKELQDQLDVVRDEIARLTAEEKALTGALASLNGNGASAPKEVRVSTRRGKTSVRRSAANGARKRRPRGGTSKSTADRVEELRGVLADGPKSRTALAAALKVSPARVQQLLAELGGSVSSQADPHGGRGKVWSLKAARNGTATPGPVSRRGAKARKAPAEKTSARRKSAAK